MCRSWIDHPHSLAAEREDKSLASGKCLFSAHDFHGEHATTFLRVVEPVGSHFLEGDSLLGEQLLRLFRAYVVTPSSWYASFPPVPSK
jgi:hypothetical protein